MKCRMGLNAKQDKIIVDVVRKKFMEYEKSIAVNEAIVLAFALMEFLTISKERLIRFYKFYFRHYRELLDRYEFDTLEDFEWICEHKLLEKGIDMRKIYNELVEEWEKENGKIH